MLSLYGLWMETTKFGSQTNTMWFFYGFQVDNMYERWLIWISPTKTRNSTWFNQHCGGVAGEKDHSRREDTGHPLELFRGWGSVQQSTLYLLIGFLPGCQEFLTPKFQKKCPGQDWVMLVDRWVKMRRPVLFESIWQNWLNISILW